MAKIVGKKGGQKKEHTPIQTPDSLQSMATAKILIALAEGEIEGNISASDIMFDGTPIADSNGKSNFPGVVYDFRPGTLTQDMITGFPETINDQSESQDLLTNKPFEKQILDAKVNAVRIRIDLAGLSDQKKNGDLLGSRVDYKIETKVGSGSYGNATTYSFIGKASSLYQRSHRIERPAGATNANPAWSVRVSRITPDASPAADTYQLVNATKISGYTEIVEAKLRYPHTALLYVAFDAKQINNIPQVSIKLKGRKILIPSNYDPVNRTYAAGDWDGTFKMAYSNNPAWVFYDICRDKRFGLGNRLTEKDSTGAEVVLVDKWQLYAIGKMCDAQVDDGKGGKEPRFLCDVYIQSQNEAFNVLRDLASIFRGMTYWANDQLFALADFDAEPIYIYSRANVVDGKFTYSGGSEKHRYSTAMVSFSDKNNHYNDDIEPVADTKLITRYGVKQLDLTAIGCTRRTEAHRRGRWALLSNAQDRTITFTTGLDGFIPRPGLIIGVNDNLLTGFSMGGRIKAVSGPRLTLDRVPTGVKVNDKMMVNSPTGKMLTAKIIAISGNIVTVDSAFSPLPEVESVWSVEEADQTGIKMQRYRVTNVTDNSNGTFTITGVFHNKSKYDYIDKGARLDEIKISGIPSNIMPAPRNVKLSSYSRVEQTLSIETMRVEWDEVPDAIAYEAQWRKDNGDWVNVPRTSGKSFEIPGIYSGHYIAHVRAINIADVSSPWGESNSALLQGKKQALPKPQTPGTEALLWGIKVLWGFQGFTSDLLHTEIKYTSTAGQNPQTAPAAGNGIIALGQVAYPGTEFMHTGLKPAEEYYYSIRMTDRLGNKSPWSDWAHGQSSDQIVDYLTKLDAGLKDTNTYKAMKAIADNANNTIKQVQPIVSQAQTDIINLKTQAKKAIDDAAKVAQDLKTFTDVTIVQNFATEVTNRNTEITKQIATERAKIDTYIAGKVADINKDIVKNSNDITKNATQTAQDIQAAADHAAHQLELSENNLDSKITTVSKAVQTAESNFATQLAQVAAGTGEQFDPWRIWYYTDNATPNEIWTASHGTPVVSPDGWIKAPAGTDNGLISPDDLDFSGSDYQFVKLRVRSHGDPKDWEGKLYWMYEGETAFVEGTAANPRSMTITGVNWATNGGVETIAFEGIKWTDAGHTPPRKVKQIRIDLAKTETAANYFEIDWLAIGRPTPGAGMAALQRIENALSDSISQETTSRNDMIARILGTADFKGTIDTLSKGLLYEERKARVDKDSAIASDVQALQADLGNTKTSFSGSINNLATINLANVAAIDQLKADLTSGLAGKADTKVTNQLSTDIQTAGRNITSTNNALTELKNNLKTSLDDLRANGDNLISNPSFELDFVTGTGIDRHPWIIDSKLPASPGWQVVSSTGTVPAYSGTKLIKCGVNNPAAAANIYQKFNVQAGHTYRISCMYWLSQDFTYETGNANQNKLRLGYFDAQDKDNIIGQSLSFPLSGVPREQWVEISDDFDITTDQEVTIGVRAYPKAGTIYIDSVSVVDITLTNAVTVNTTNVKNNTDEIAKHGSRISTVEQQYSAIEQTVSNLKTGTVTNQDFDVLKGRVDVNEQGISAGNNRITSLETNINYADNMLPNPLFLNNAVGWVSGVAGTNGVIPGTLKVETIAGSPVLSSDVSPGPVSPSFRVQAGDNLEISADLYAYADVGNTRLYLDLSGNNFTSTQIDLGVETVPVNGWKSHKATTIIPTGAQNARLRVLKTRSGRVGISNVRIVRLNDATVSNVKAVSDLKTKTDKHDQTISQISSSNTLLTASLNRRGFYRIETRGGTQGTSGVFDETDHSTTIDGTNTAVRLDRGYNLIVFGANSDGKSLIKSAKGYDTYDGTTVAATSTTPQTNQGAVNAKRFSDDVDALPEGTNVAVVGRDEPNRNKDKVRAALQKLGGAADTLDRIKDHSAYILLGKKGLTPGSALEYVDLDGSSPNNGHLDIIVSLIRDEIQGLPTELQAIKAAADVQALSVLEGRVDQTEDDISTQNQNLVSLKSNLLATFSRGDNILSNSQFTEDLLGWNKQGNGTIEWAAGAGSPTSTDAAHPNPKGAVILTRGPTNQMVNNVAVQTYLESIRIAVQPGHRYRLILTAKSGIAGKSVTAQMWLRSFPSISGATLDTFRSPNKTFGDTFTTQSFDTGAVVTTNGVTTVTGGTNANAHYIAPSIYNTGAQNDKLIVDSFYVEDITNALNVNTKVSTDTFNQLKSTVTDSNTGLVAVNQAVQSLKTTIEDTKTGLPAKVSTSTFEQLLNKVEDKASGLDVVNQKVTSLNNTVALKTDLTSGLAAKADKTALADKADKTALAGKVDQSDYDTLTAEVHHKDTGLTALNTKYTTLSQNVDLKATKGDLTTGLATKANQSDFSKIEQKVNNTTTGIAAVNQKLNTLQQTVDSLPDATDLSTALASKADQTAFTTLQQEVDNKTTGLAAVNTKYDGLKQAVDLKAVKTDVDKALQGKVAQGDFTKLEQKVDAPGTGLDAVNTKINTLTNNAALKTDLASYVTQTTLNTTTQSIKTAAAADAKTYTDNALKTAKTASDKYTDDAITAQQTVVTKLSQSLSRNQADKYQLLVNGDFNTGENGTAFWESTGSSWKLENTGGHNTASVITLNANADHSLYQTVYVIKGHKYRLSCWVKFASGSTISAANWGNNKLRIGRGAGLVIAKLWNAATTSSPAGAIDLNWKEQVLEWDADQTGFITVGAWANITTGKIYIDDFQMLDKTGDDEINELKDDVSKLSKSNLLPDPSFEVHKDTVNAIGVIDSATDTTKQYARTGNRCIRFKRTIPMVATGSNKNPPNEDFFIDQLVPCAPNQLFYVSGWFRADFEPANVAINTAHPNATFGLGLRFRRSPTADSWIQAVNSGIKVSSLTNTWQKFEGYVTAPSDAVSVQGWLTWGGGNSENAVGVSVLVDDLVIAEATNLGSVPATITGHSTAIQTLNSEVDANKDDITAAAQRLDDLENMASSGKKNFWMQRVFDMSKITVGTYPTLANIKGLAPMHSGEIADAVKVDFTADGVKRIMHLRAWVYLEAGKDITFAAAGRIADDTGAIFVNNVQKATISATVTSLTVKFDTGWSLLDILIYQNTGQAYFQQTDKLSTKFDQFYSGAGTLAVSSAVNLLTSKVVSNDQELSAQSQLITKLENSLNDTPAGGVTALYNWEFEKDTEGFGAQNGAISHGTSSIIIKPSTTDPFILKQGLSIPGNINTLVRWRIRNNSVTAAAPKLDSNYQLFWITAAHGILETNSIKGNFTGLDGAWRVFEVDLSKNADWTSSTITGLRLDFWNATNTAEIDWIVVGKPGVVGTSTAFQTLSSDVEQLKTDSADQDAKNKAVDAALAKANSDIAGHTAKISGYDQKFTDQTAKNAAYDKKFTDQTTKNNALDKSIADQVKALGDAVGDIALHDAAIKKNAGDITSQSSSIQQLTATVNNSKASVDNLVNSIAQTALAQNETFMQQRAQIGDNFSQVQELSKTFTDTEQSWSQRLVQLEANFNSNSASVIELQKAVSDPTGSVATQVNQLKASVDSVGQSALDAGNKAATAQATVTQFQSAVATIEDGVNDAKSDIAGLKTHLDAQWGVKVETTNGKQRVAGMIQLGVDGTQKESQFIVAANTFAVTNPADVNTSITPFLVNGQGVWMNGAYIQDATITEAKIRNATISAAKFVDTIQSDGAHWDNNPDLLSGWAINCRNGNAWFGGNVTISGGVYAREGRFGFYKDHGNGGVVNITQDGIRINIPGGGVIILGKW